MEFSKNNGAYTPGGTPKNGGSCQASGYYAGGYTGVHGTVHEGTVG